MSFKSIHTFVDGSDAGEKQLASAIEVCRRADGHLSVAAIGYEPDVPTYALADGAASVVADLIADARQRAVALTEATNETLRREDIRGDAAPVTSTHAGLASAFGRAARFADLAVLGPVYDVDSERMSLAALEGSLFEAMVPVLVCPKAEVGVFDNVMIAWHGDREGLRAVRYAMPFLTAAKAVEVVMIDPPASETDPAEDLAVYLSRHGVHVTTFAQPGGANSVAGALGRRVLETGADLLVMGGYSHSRFREYVLGGVTRDVLHNLPSPVLIAHS